MASEQVHTVGGMRGEEPVTPDVQAVLDSVRAKTQQAAQASGWNGIFTEFTGVKVATQVSGAGVLVL